MRQNKNARVRSGRGIIMRRCVSTSRHVGFVRVITERIMRNKYHKEMQTIVYAPFRGEGIGERGMTPLDGRSRRLRRRSSSRSRLVKDVSDRSKSEDGK